MRQQFCRIAHAEPSCPRADLWLNEYWQGNTLERLISFDWRGEYGEFLSPQSRDTLQRLLDSRRLGIESETMPVAMAALEELVAVLDDPPWQIRRDRRIGQGPLPEAEAAHNILNFVRKHTECSSSVVFEVWDKTSGRSQLIPASGV